VRCSLDVTERGDCRPHGVRRRQSDELPKQAAAHPGPDAREFRPGGFFLEIRLIFPKSDGVVTILGNTAYLTKRLPVSLCIASNNLCGKHMRKSRLFKRLLKSLRNEHRFTATEYGILAALTIIAAEQMAMKI
jgi:hypothetical protein